jgi:alkylglycerol monooxygenase
MHHRRTDGAAEDVPGVVTAIRLLHRLVIATATLATLCELFGWNEMFGLTKPLPMALAVILLLAGPAGERPARLLLALAMAAALAGDVLLLFPDGFILGLVAFLGTHSCYLLLFRRGVGWFPVRLAPIAVLALSGVILAWEFPLLPASLRLPVAVYTSIIALMVSQAIGRAARLGTRDAWLVAVGAALFMASDTMISIDRFVLPFALSGFAIMASYYLGQILILRHALTDAAVPGRG